METSGANQGQLDRQAPETATTDSGATPEQEGTGSSVHDVESLSSEDRGTATRAMLKIATAVENIFSLMSRNPADK